MISCAVMTPSLWLSSSAGRLFCGSRCSTSYRAYRAPRTSTRAHQDPAGWQLSPEWWGTPDTQPRQDPGSWELSPEWWGTHDGGWGRTAGTVVFQEHSQAANGVVTVTAHPASPLPHHASTPQEWRVLRFNGVTRQSVARVTLSTPLKAWPQALAFEYLKTMAAATAALAGALWGPDAATAPLRVLCVGVGGGSLPLFLSHHFPHWQVCVCECMQHGSNVATTGACSGQRPHSAACGTQRHGATQVALPCHVRRD